MRWVPQRAQDVVHNLAYLRRPPVQLAVCAIFRNEARHLAEWVTFHRLVGVERFYLYDNDSTDDWREVLAPELAAGIVEATYWPQQYGQMTAYADCLRRHRTDTRWIAFIDLDEFLFSPTGRSLPSVLHAFRTWPGVAVCSRYFGFGGWDEPPDGLAIESYLMRAPDDFRPNALIKSIVFPRMAKRPTDFPHDFVYRHSRSAAGEDGRPASGERVPPTAELLRINHYYTRSRAEYAAKRAAPSAWMPRGDRPPADDRVPPDVVRDETMLRWAPLVRRALRGRG